MCSLNFTISTGSLTKELPPTNKKATWRAKGKINNASTKKRSYKKKQKEETYIEAKTHLYIIKNL